MSFDDLPASVPGENHLSEERTGSPVNEDLTVDAEGQLSFPDYTPQQEVPERTFYLQEVESDAESDGGSSEDGG